jgi:nicotinic acid phosphoribosyltransferase
MVFEILRGQRPARVAPNLTGDIDVDKVKQIVKEFPEVAGFGIGTKLSSEIPAVAGVIFKQCLMKNRPTLKASNSRRQDHIAGPFAVVSRQ